MAIIQAPVVSQTLVLTNLPPSGVSFPDSEWGHIPYNRSEPCLVFLVARINNNDLADGIFSLFPGQATPETGGDVEYSLELPSFKRGSISVYRFVANPVNGEPFRVWVTERTKASSVPEGSGRLTVIPLTI